MRTFCNAISLVLLLTALAACGGPKTSDRVLVFVDPPAATELMSGGGGGILGIVGPSRRAWVDVRNQRDFEMEHIPGALHLPFQDVSTGHKRLLDYDLLIVYGDDYSDVKGEAMSKRLIQLGHRDVRTLRGGLEAWKNAGMETDGE